MKHVVATVLALSVCVSAFGAKIFKWVDDKGHVQYTTTPPPEATMDKVQKTFDYVPPSPEEKALAALHSAEAAQSYEAVQQDELDKLSDREKHLAYELDQAREKNTLFGSGPKIKSIQSELDFVRRQKMALLGHESPAADADERLSKLEKRVTRAEHKPIVEDFTLNGSQCQRVGTDIRCIRF